MRLASRVRFKRLFRPRWLVYQTKANKASREVLIYAEVFWRKSKAEKAQTARNKDVASVGKYTWGARRWALLIDLATGERLV
jgi:hypothetical protein